MVFAFVVLAASNICLQESSIRGTQYDLSLILIFCFGAICKQNVILDYYNSTRKVEKMTDK